MIYTFDLDTPKELIADLAGRMQKRRLEKGWSRAALSRYSGVPVPTIARFEQQHSISLLSFIALVQALGYTEEIKALLSTAKFSTMEELATINANQTRQRGR